MPKKSTNLKYYESIGRRKSAVARVRLYIASGSKEVKVGSGLKLKKGDIIVNNLPLETYFPGDVMTKGFMRPLELTDSVNRFAISVLVNGGGKNGQLEASSLGISRALEQADPSNRSILKPDGMLTRDARVRERRKPGTGGRARRQKQSPKR